jgi:hypothetical protein
VLGEAAQQETAAMDSRIAELQKRIEDEARKERGG